MDIDKDREFKEKVTKIVGDYLQSSAFTGRKLTDTPTDDLMVVNRRFVTSNGTSALRPPAPVTGQFYFDTTLGKPIWYNGSIWVKSDGTAA